MRECQKVFLRPIDIRFEVAKAPLDFTSVADAERFPEDCRGAADTLLSLWMKLYCCRK
jgi:hypothetical protein